MHLVLKPSHKNIHPKRGVLIRGPVPHAWLHEIGGMGLRLEDVSVYPLPGAVANEIFGCLVVFGGSQRMDIGRNSYVRLANDTVFLPEYTELYPELSGPEWQKLFGGRQHLYHPETGLVELPEPMEWASLLVLPEQAHAAVIVPSKGVAIPQNIHSHSIEIDGKELAESVEKGLGEIPEEKPPFNLDKVMKGNAKEMDKFLKYLEKHPEMALKFAIPLDAAGATRGGNGGRFIFNGGRSFNPGSDLTLIIGSIVLVGFIIAIVANIGSGSSGGRGIGVLVAIIFFIARFLNGALSGNNGRSGGSAVIDDDRFATLQKRYEKLANEYIAQGDYHKAAGIYLRLLKNPYQAALTLENGGMYGEAGAIWLKHCQNKAKAAECFENGKLYSQAIELYKELDDKEKVGDLYLVLNNRREAHNYFRMVAEDYENNKMYVKASLIYRKKMQDPQAGQQLLLQGWHNNLDGYNCLNNYFANIDDHQELIAEIERFYGTELIDAKSESFLQLMKHEYKKDENLKQPVRDIAYKIIASRIAANPQIASELVHFNKEDKNIVKDVMKYKASRLRR